MDENRLRDEDDDELQRPTVTPVPAPADDQLLRLVGTGVVLGGVLTLALVAWLRRHVVVSWRR